MQPTDHHLRREDRTLLWQRIADHVASHPQDLSIALDNIKRWETLGRVHPAPLIEWRKRIQAAQTCPTELRAFVAFLAEPNHDAQAIKSCSPFIGLPIASSPSENP